ncbi:YlbF family regulator [[Bacteroides] pectinophilus]|jgi:cell fate (sporulation/competence/biofilm development) regulator YlbF (YheA/YmcA/DUF963 family)|uniref:YlbF family regulator n=2 Tax=[Bacteroides] pectinophilus TaxID=384638 RepID=B7APW5_9FIRM|nr:hypothetical protein BACPEC_00721 [[Bacteroides] pectinophilus ATCC 43243]MCI6022039.1 YlbF family regulator [[Bacteroides] pectinophilus]MEE0058793.1 YlbF family regulator [[Bacteroides] pectinophilus]UWN97000.1 YlbF family regulator [[Bacteroides] pectinophilus]CDD56612.1 putative uncharacterized protein [Bacteroides pectinophilus CAG:437]
MSEVERLTDELCRAIRTSREYAEYKEAYKILEQYPGLLRETNELRRQNFELQNSEDSDGMFDRVETFRKNYAELRKHQEVSDFLQAELCLARMVQSIGNAVTGCLDMNVDFLD